EKSLEEVVKQWQTAKKNHLSSHLTSFLHQAELFNQSQASLLKQNWIANNDLEQLQGFLAAQLKAYPDLPYAAWATPQGNYIGIARGAQDTFQVEIAGQKTQWRYETYELTPQGRRGKLQKTFPFYDPRQRPWYQTAIQKKQATWTPVYLWFDQSQLALDAVLPVYNTQGQLLGVADTPLPLAQISQFLQQASLLKGSKSFIVERSGDLIASSTPETFLRREGQKVERLQVHTYGDRHLALASRVLSPKWLGNLQANYPQSFTIRDNHQRFFVYVFTFQHGTAIDWLVYLMVPETAFIQPFQTMNNWILIATLLIMGVGILLSFLLTRWIATPILDIHQASLAIASGNWHQRVKVSSSYELNNLAQAFNQMADQLKQAFAGLDYEIYHDHLTQLPNRNYLNQFMAKMFREMSEQEDREWAVIFMDIDDFKLINDSLGYLEGDELLKQASHRLRTCLASENILARFGGDEFVMILKNIRSHPEVIQIVERVINQFRYPFHLENHRVSINISLGITFSSLGYKHPQELLRDASIALFQAKKMGKNGYQIMTPAMQYPAIQRLQMKTELQEALKQQQFCLYFQPLINLYTQQLVGFETLIRWRHPERGLVSPQEFIPLAEETGLIEWIDLWVLNAACQQIEQWQEVLDITDPL
ncbi:MAG: diguanylate cyclase domain-containing protein, partial [Microcystaceae cyanobacterium]